MQIPKATICAATLVALLSACTTTSNKLSDEPYNLTVLHTNDHHGRFWKNREGEYGMAARKTVIDAIRQEVRAAGGRSLLLDGGDVNTGVPESDLQDAVPDFLGMNLLGYDAMAVGNHEFDKSPSVLTMQRELARFPMLSANIYRGNERLFEPYRIFNLDGLRVAVIGLTTEDTQKMVHPDNTRGIDFRSPIQEAAALIPSLRKQADIVIAATHMGHYENGQHGTQAPGDVEMARAVNGLDLVVGGHTQNPACMKAENVLDRAYVPGTDCTPDHQNGAWIVQAHEWGKYVGRADFTYHRGVFKLVKYSLIPINLKRPAKAPDGATMLTTHTPEIPESKAMLELLSPYQEFGQQKLLTSVGRSDALLEGDRNVVRKRPTSLGNLIGLAMMDRTHADFAIVNAGGIRDSLPAGVITYRDILKVHPFGNTIATIDLSGQEVWDYLNAAIKMSPGSGGYPQFAGIRLSVTAGAIHSATVHGVAINPTKIYRVAINNFMASGGDGYPKMTTHSGYTDTGYVDAEVVRAFVSANSPLTAARFAPWD